MQIRKLEQNELAEAVKLADLVFQKDAQYSMGKSFPSLFNPGISHSYGALTDDGRLAAFMGMAPGIIHVGQARLKVFGLGAVCTHPDYRGQNLASTLLEQCQQHAIRSGASLVFISGDRSLYRRGGCVPFGRVELARLTPSAAAQLQQSAGSDQWMIRDMNIEDTFEIHRLIGKTDPAYEIGPGELLTLLHAKAIANNNKMEQVTLVAERNGGIEGFVVAAVPAAQASLSGPSASDHAAAVQWGGKPEAISQLLACIFQKYPVQHLEVAIPWQEDILCRLIRQTGAHMKSQANSGTVWLTDAQTLLEQCAPYNSLEGDETEIVFHPEERSYTLIKNGDRLELDDNGLLSLLFDPESPYKSWAPQNFSTLPLPYLSGLHFI